MTKRDSARPKRSRPDRSRPPTATGCGWRSCWPPASATKSAAPQARWPARWRSPAPSPNSAAEALDIAAKAAAGLASRLRLLRAAWTGGAEALDITALRALCAGLPRQVWADFAGLPAEQRFPAGPARVLLNVLLLAAESLPKGGVVTLGEAGPDTVLVVPRGQAAAWPPGLAAWMADPAPAWRAATSAAPRLLQGPLTALLAHGAGVRLSFALAADAETAPPLLLRFDEAARHGRANAAEPAGKPDLAGPSPVPGRRLPAGATAVALLCAVLAVGATAGWYRMSDTTPGAKPARPVQLRLTDLVQPRPAPNPTLNPAPAAAAALPPLAAEPPPPPALSPPPPVPAAPPALVAELAPPPPAALPSVALPASLPPASAAIPASGVAGPPLTGTPASPASGVSPLPEGTRIVLRATANAWLEVRERQGPVLLRRVLRPGETWPVPPYKQPARLLLSTGNAGGTEVLVDGQLTAPLGNNWVVRHDLPLDPDAILEGRLAPAVVASARSGAPKR